MNSIWNRATGSIPYQIVFNRKPCYKRIQVAHRAFEQVEFREISASYDIDDLLNRIQANEINEADERSSAPISQAEADFRERNEFPELIDAQYARARGAPLPVSESAAIGSSSRQQAVDDDDDDEDMLQALRASEADELQRQRLAETIRNRELNKDVPPIDPAINDPFFSRPVLPPPANGPPVRSTDDETAGSRIEVDDENQSFHTPPPGIPSTPPPQITQADTLSPSLQRMAINAGNPAELDFTPTTSLRKNVQVRQRHANERARRQYGKQRHVVVFEIGDQVSVALPEAVRSSTDDSRAFGLVIGLKEDLNQYQILTRFGVLDKYVPIDNLNRLKDTIDLQLPVPPPSKLISLKQLADAQSMTQKVPVKCNCKARNRCTTGSCRCIQAKVKCSIACHTSMGVILTFAIPARIFLP